MSYSFSFFLMNGVILKNIKPRQDINIKGGLLQNSANWICYGKFLADFAGGPKISTIVTHCTGNGHTKIFMSHETPVVTLWKTSCFCQQSWLCLVIGVNTTVLIQVTLFCGSKQSLKQYNKSISDVQNCCKKAFWIGFKLFIQKALITNFLKLSA